MNSLEPFSRQGDAKSVLRSTAWTQKAVIRRPHMALEVGQLLKNDTLPAESGLEADIAESTLLLMSLRMGRQFKQHADVRIEVAGNQNGSDMYARFCPPPSNPF